MLSMNSSLWPFSQNAPVKSISKLVLKPSYTCVGMREIGILNGQFFYTCHILVVRTVLRFDDGEVQLSGTFTLYEFTWRSMLAKLALENLKCLLS